MLFGPTHLEPDHQPLPRECSEGPPHGDLLLRLSQAQSPVMRTFIDERGQRDRVEASGDGECRAPVLA
jgi:hypothetical protein